MEKQTKNILTRKFIEDELRFQCKANRRYATVLCICCAPICVLMAFLMYWGASEFNNTVVKVILSIVLSLIPIAPIIAFLYTIYISLRDAKSVDRGEYDIIIRELSYKSEEYRRRGRNHDLVELLHFPGFKPIEVDSTTYQLASNDDVFYFVVYRKKDAQPSLIYSSKMYELSDKEIML